jgi:mRNA interferase RelE/StbE
VKYRVILFPRAARDLGAIRQEQAEAIARKVDQLADQPGPPGCKKLKGSDYWRVRVGDYRVIYEIVDQFLLVSVMRVGNRRDVYR